jgi:hypothetical protein
MNSGTGLQRTASHDSDSARKDLDSSVGCGADLAGSAEVKKNHR